MLPILSQLFKFLNETKNTLVLHLSRFLYNQVHILNLKNTFSCRCLLGSNSDLMIQKLR